MQIKLDAKGHLFSLSRQPALSPTNPYQNKTRNTSNFCSTHTNPYKLIPPYTPFPFQIKFLNHSHQLLIFQPLPQFPRNPPQILQCNHPLVIRIKQRKSPQYLVPRIPLTNQFRSNSLELGSVKVRRPGGRGSFGLSGLLAAEWGAAKAFCGLDGG